MDLNNTFNILKDLQNGFTVIMTAFLQALFLNTANVRIIMTIVLSGTFTIMYIDPFIFEYFNIKKGSGLESLIYGISTLMGAELVQIILIIMPDIIRKRIEEMIGLTYLKGKDK